MKKILLLFIVTSTIISCENSYEKEEFQAIQDFANNYLEKTHLEKVLNPNSFFEDKPTKKIDIETLDLKVYISDVLIPISQIKEDNEWMFKDNYSDDVNNKIFNEIINSNQFKNLNYKEFNKNDFKLIKPYRQFEKSQEKIRADEEYNILKFSRVCFDKERKNGIVVIENNIGMEGLTSSGYHMALLIKKIDDKWIYIPRK